jgi:AAA+ ATPase superfamily predicted ATPase
MKYKPNPFAFGKIVKGKQFFNRKVEKIELIKDINDHQNIILYAPRRYGKTSLILNVFDDIKRKNKRFAGFYIDFYKINTVGDFLTAMSDE